MALSLPLRRLKRTLIGTALAAAAFAGTPAHADKIKNPTAIFAGLDKITGRIISFEVAVDETVQFGALQLTPRALLHAPAHRAAEHDGLHRGGRGDVHERVPAHLRRLGLRLEPRPARHRAPDLRRVADGLQRRHRRDRRSVDPGRVAETPQPSEPKARSGSRPAPDDHAGQRTDRHPGPGRRAGRLRASRPSASSRRRFRRSSRTRTAKSGTAAPLPAPLPRAGVRL